MLFGGQGSSSKLSDLWEWNGTNWSRIITANVPVGRSGHGMVYDTDRQRLVLFGGHDANSVVLNDTWEWDGTNWMQQAVIGPSGRTYHAMAYDPARKRTVLAGGQFLASTYFNYGLHDTWFWNGTNWSLHSQSDWTFDMSTKADGVWNFTDIYVAKDVTVRFQKNAANTPVRWLATTNVSIQGTLNVSGIGVGLSDVIKTHRGA